MSFQILELESLALDDVGRVVLPDDLLDAMGDVVEILSAGANGLCSGSGNSFCTNGTCGWSTNSWSCTNVSSCDSATNSTTCR